MGQTRANARRPGFLRAEDGGMMPFGLFMFLLLMMVGGFGVDIAHHYKARTQLQIAADVTAHAALHARRRSTEAEAIAFALGLLEGNMPAARYGLSIGPDDIEFGTVVGGTFQPQPGARSAVRVRGGRDATRANALRTFLLRFAGVPWLDVAAVSAFVTYQPICLDEGFVAEGRVDVQSNNNYLRGFCIHSNDYVRFNQNNYFEAGVIVSMPDLDRLRIPASGFERNEGLEAALRQGTIDIRILRELGDVLAGLRANDAEYGRAYITSAVPVLLPQTRNNNTLDVAQLLPGRIHEIHCDRSGAKLTVPNEALIERVVIVTNCQFELGRDARMEDAVVFSTNTGRHAVSGASGVTIGRPDGCAPGGGAQIVTLGDMNFPANLGLFGGQLIAAGNISFAARADGVEGGSIIAGGVIDGTSNSTMARCNAGMEDAFQSPYYRMVF